MRALNLNSLAAIRRSGTLPMRLFPSRLLAAAMVVLSLGAFSVATAAGAPSVRVPDDMSQGNPKAKVTVVEYASVACPICGRWYKEVYPAFKAKYINTGKIHFVTREMLVGDDAEVGIATAGFLLARCAGKDKYYTVTDAIYHSQPDKPDDEAGLYGHPHEVLLGIAKRVGISEPAFQVCITNPVAIKALNGRVDTYVKRDHVDGTPTFIINGKALETGYHPLSELDAAIAAAEAKK
jgi:protein-disulfide isomerase